MKTYEIHVFRPGERAYVRTDVEMVRSDKSTLVLKTRGNPIFEITIKAIGGATFIPGIFPEPIEVSMEQRCLDTSPFVFGPDGNMVTGYFYQVDAIIFVVLDPKQDELM